MFPQQDTKTSNHNRVYSEELGTKYRTVTHLFHMVVPELSHNLTDTESYPTSQPLPVCPVKKGQLSISQECFSENKQDQTSICGLLGIWIFIAVDLLLLIILPLDILSSACGFSVTPWFLQVFIHGQFQTLQISPLCLSSVTRQAPVRPGLSNLVQKTQGAIFRFRQSVTYTGSKRKISRMFQLPGIWVLVPYSRQDSPRTAASHVISHS